jgi:hypothetical protein
VIPDYLRSTYQLVASAFPAGIDQESYLPLLKVLANYMSQRNLADVVALYTGKDVGIIYNDILGAIDVVLPDNVLQRVRNALEANGLQSWIDEG